MKEWQTPIVLGFLFALRCLVPILLMFLIGYGMNKLSCRMASQEQVRRSADAAQIALFGPTWEGKGHETPARCKVFHNPAIPFWISQQRVCGCRRPDECLCSPFYHVVPV